MPLSTRVVATGLRTPVFATAPRNDRNRLFIVERGDKLQPGRVRILDLGSEKLLPNPFLSVAEASSDFGEQGLLGLAFHPSFESNGFLYVNFTQHPGGDPDRLVTTVRRYRASASNPNAVDPASATNVLTIEQPSPPSQFKNHKGGWLAFGPDGFLYVATGDGGPLSGNDPRGHAQNLGVLLGKLLRIDVDHDDFPSDPDRNYAVPPTNPFVQRPLARPEIWAYGLRNPWRCSFDRKSGDLYVADVGQGAIEEINVQRASSKGGENYGWRIKEGRRQTGLESLPAGLALVDPVSQYDHSAGELAIIGGYVYRGSAIAGLDGTYVYADMTGTVRCFRYEGVDDPSERSIEVDLFPEGMTDIYSFGEDAAGELYICVGAGKVFRIVGTEP